MAENKPINLAGLSTFKTCIEEEFNSALTETRKVAISAYSMADVAYANSSYAAQTAADAQATASSAYFSALAANEKANAIPVVSGTGENSAQQKGTGSLAKGKNSFACGNGTVALGTNSHAEGNSSYPICASTITSATSNEDIITAWAQSNFSLAKGQNAHVEGNNCLALSNHSHVEGNQTIAKGQQSHAEGYLTETKNLSEHAEGRCNLSHSDIADKWGYSGNTLSSVGIGQNANSKKNALEIMQNGDIYVSGVGNYDGVNLDEKQTLQKEIERVGYGVRQYFRKTNDGQALVISEDECKKGFIAYHIKTAQNSLRVELDTSPYFLNVDSGVELTLFLKNTTSTATTVTFLSVNPQIDNVYETGEVEQLSTTGLVSHSSTVVKAFIVRTGSDNFDVYLYK